jgi:hypothetical protein
VTAGSEPLTQVLGKRPDVKARRALDSQRNVAVVDGQNLNLVARDLNAVGERFLRNRRSRPPRETRDTVAARSPDVLGGEGRRLLEKRSTETVQRTLDVVATRHRPLISRTHWRTVPIAAVGSLPEAHHRVVGLVAAAQELCEARRASDEQHEHAGGSGIERAGVADAAFAEHAPHPVDHVVRGWSERLIDD